MNLFAFLLIVSLIDIACRHFGTWGQIKAELIAYDTAIKEFEQQNGVMNTEEKAVTFVSTHPKKKFILNGKEVRIAFWDVNTNPRVGISWDGGSGNARFDLQTMYVVYTD